MIKRTPVVWVELVPVKGAEGVVMLQLCTANASRTITELYPEDLFDPACIAVDQPATIAAIREIVYPILEKVADEIKERRVKTVYDARRAAEKHRHMSHSAKRWTVPRSSMRAAKKHPSQ